MNQWCFQLGNDPKWAPLVVPPDLNGDVLRRFLDLLTGLDEDFLRANPRTPLLYDTQVKYVRDPPGREQWLTTPWVLNRQAGDCKSLASWRAAELRVRGDRAAQAVWSASRTPQGTLFHVRVSKTDPKRPGRVVQEDPSLILGMGWREMGADHTVVKSGLVLPSRFYK